MTKDHKPSRETSSETLPETSLARGAALIRRYAKSLPETPGVYRMLDQDGKALYVGKAKALKKRVETYANVDKLPLRLQRMVAETQEMMFVHTHTEVEALLLESNLIKKLKPRYNVLLRDDKSFPYILITGDHEFPLLTKHRGARKRKGDYYGPFASVGAVNRTLIAMQKAFMLRNCTDSYFANRKRPCLQYHIKRCTAPCVGKVSAADYAQQVREAKEFLSGKSHDIQSRLATAMQEASDAMEFEKAAGLRDRIRALTSVQARQDINVRNMGDADVIGLFSKDGKTCVQVFFFRAGQNFGNHAYFPRHSADDTPAEILGAFMAQFYENKPVPSEIITSIEPQDRELLEEALGGKTHVHTKSGVKITVPQRGARKRLVDFVLKNAEDALAREALKLASEVKLLKGVAELFGLDDIPQRIEVYDNSHISGTNMVGGMIVAGPEGFRKAAYRKFNIKTADAADDYGMMREVMERRFGRALKEANGPGTPDWPDILLVDGGLGQFNMVKDVLEDLGVYDDTLLVSISKGPDRNAGREKFLVAGREDEPFQLSEQDAVLHYLQRLRDEAHRFAITTHRARRTKQISDSPLDGVPGIGAKRKKALLLHFGSGKEVQNAGVHDLQKVEGISAELAQTIYDYFHDEA